MKAVAAPRADFARKQRRAPITFDVEGTTAIRAALSLRAGGLDSTAGDAPCPLDDRDARDLIRPTSDVRRIVMKGLNR